MTLEAMKNSPTTHPTNLLARKTLIVDDEDKAVVEMVDFLRRRGLEIEGMSDSRSALVAIAEDESLGALVTDLKMAHIDGYRLIEIARERRRHGHFGNIIAITGHATPADERRAFECGATHFFQKPLDLRAIARALMSSAWVGD